MLRSKFMEMMGDDPEAEGTDGNTDMEDRMLDEIEQERKMEEAITGEKIEEEKEDAQLGTKTAKGEQKKKKDDDVIMKENEDVKPRIGKAAIDAKV